MSQLTLEWQESNQTRIETISDSQASQHSGTVRIGRDPSRCDLVLTHPTVSGLHIEIFFNPNSNQFLLRNLRDVNPPIVDGKRIVTEEVPLHLHSKISLGQMVLQVSAISLSPVYSSIPQTIILPPEPTQEEEKEVNVTYGLKCPNCDRVSRYDRIDFGCIWCGTSLAAAVSVLIQPSSKS